MELKDWAELATIVAGFCTAGILIVTLFANQHIKTLSEYANKQTDRAVIEDIFLQQTEVQRDFLRSGRANDIRRLATLAGAQAKADLYGLNDIKLHLNKITDAYGKAYVLHNSVWSDEGYVLSQYNHEDMKAYHQLVRELHVYFDDIACYKKHLHIRG